jgi:hypothetical protein
MSKAKHTHLHVPNSLCYVTPLDTHGTKSNAAAPESTVQAQFPSMASTQADAHNHLPSSCSPSDTQGAFKCTHTPHDFVITYLHAWFAGLEQPYLLRHRQPHIPDILALLAFTKERPTGVVAFNTTSPWQHTWQHALPHRTPVTVYQASHSVRCTHHMRALTQRKGVDTNLANNLEVSLMCTVPHLCHHRRQPKDAGVLEC